MSSTDAEHPLAGRTVVVTRARHQSKELIELLERLGARVIAFPTIEIEAMTDLSALDRALQNISTYTAMLVGSKNAADIVFNRAAKLGITIDRPIGCVGEKT